MELLSGSLNGAGSLGGNAKINWAGGTLGGTQHVASGAVFNITGDNRKYLAGGTVLNNAGVVNWSGPGDIHAWSRGWNGEAPSTINNLAGGQFRFLTEGAPFVRNGDYCHFNNHGTLWKVGGTNETTVHSFIVNNFGNVLAQTGALAFVDYVNLGSNTTLQGESRIRFAGFVTTSNNVMASGVVRVDGGWFNAEINTNGTPRSIWAGTNTLEWMGGTLFGHHTFGSNVIVNIADPASGPATKFLGSLTTINNHGQVNWSGAARIHAWARNWYGEGPSLFNNLPGATFRFLNDGYPFARDGDYSRFTNYAGGLVVKGAGTNKTTIDSWQFANAGEIRAETGTIEFSDLLHLQNGGSLSGPGTNVISAGSHTVQGITTLNGVMRISDGTVTGSSNATFLAGSGSLEWLGGWFAGDLTLGSGLETTVSGGSTKALGVGSVLRNRGRFRWTGAGDLWSPARSWYGELPASFYNERGGVFTAENDAAFTTWGSANYFHNMEGALFVKTNGIASTACNWFFTNSGTLELCSGVLALNINPTALAGGTVNVWAGGTTPASGYAQLALAGNATLVGALNLKLRAGFAPALADSFNLVTYGSRTEEFAPVITALIENDLLWLTTYGANAFRLTVGRAFVATAPTRLSNGHFTFSLRGPEATRAVIEASEDLQTWLPIMTNDPFNGVFLFDDPGAVTRSNRFYRLRITP